MARFTLHAVAPDRPGVVAEVAQALAAAGCNLEDSRMRSLHGQFSIVLVLEAPGVANGRVIEEALAPLLESLGLQLFVRPILAEAEPPGPSERLLVAVRGADHPGTVARIAAAVAASGGNIVELTGHVAAERGDDPSHLELTVALAPGGVAQLRAALESLAGELGMRCELREAPALA